jgi:hypothetical protein
MMMSGVTHAAAFLGGCVQFWGRLNAHNVNKINN